MRMMTRPSAPWLLYLVVSMLAFILYSGGVLADDLSNEASSGLGVAQEQQSAEATTLQEDD